MDLRESLESFATCAGLVPSQSTVETVSTPGKLWIGRIQRDVPGGASAGLRDALIQSGILPQSSSTAFCHSFGSGKTIVLLQSSDLCELRDLPQRKRLILFPERPESCEIPHCFRLKQLQTSAIRTSRNLQWTGSPSERRPVRDSTLRALPGHAAPAHADRGCVSGPPQPAAVCQAPPVFFSPERVSPPGTPAQYSFFSITRHAMA